MLRVSSICWSPLISVSRLDHQPDAIHRDLKDEVAERYTINFVEDGHFGIAAHGQSWLLSPGSVFVSRPGEVRSYRHYEDIPSDVCASVSFNSEFIENLFDEPPLFLRTDQPVVLPPTNRLAFLKRQLDRLTTEPEHFALDSWASELLAAVGALSAERPQGPAYSSRQFKWYAERIEGARTILETTCSEPHSLNSLATAVGMSVFQFSRIFRQLVGVPPHRYLLTVRLSRAAEMLLDGMSITEVCYEVGYSNLSHFIRSFRRKFGCCPSAYKKHPSLSVAGALKKRKKVQAGPN
jgi:AraC family transcriptional regulator